MPEIRIASEAGACWGVERALEMVEAAIESGEDPIYTLGPLIHNPQVVASFEERGVKVSETVEVPSGSTIVLRTHGVAPEIEQRAAELGLSVIDAACPFVKRVHSAAKRLEADGYRVVIVGEKGHPEAEATAAHVQDALILGSAEEVASAELSGRVGAVVQTTMSRSTLEEVIAAIEPRVEELKLIDTICEATGGHQAAAAELAKDADVMVVVGGKNSANTRHLADISSELCAKTHHIETEDELDPSWFEGAELIGMTAGASTPASRIQAVRDAISRMVEL